MLRVALTGGIASGKSTVARLFAARDVPVIQLDDIARRVVEPGTDGLSRVIETFGSRFLDENDSLNRRLLREHVFGNREQRRQLESILHPLIQGFLEKELDNLPAETPYVIIEIPLLVESGSTDDYDRILVIDCAEDVQRERLSERDSIDAEQGGHALAAQASRAQRLAVADDVIDNSHATLAELEHQVAELDSRYRELASG